MMRSELSRSEQEILSACLRAVDGVDPRQIGLLAAELAAEELLKRRWESWPEPLDAEAPDEG